MTKMKPFRALIYNQEKIKDLASVVCPPYDIIPDNRRQYYYDKSRYNLIHILLGKDTQGEDRYERAAVYFYDWLKNKILIQNGEPAVYFYSQQYNIRGEKRTRIGFISLLHLGNREKSSAFSHEHTRLEAKEDRLRLLKKVRANLSPIFVIFSDKKRIIQRTYQQHIEGKTPFIDVTDDEKTIHKLWKLDSPDILKKFQQDMQNIDIFIADGHHRYEVACAYRDEMLEKLKNSSTGKEGFNYILAYFTGASSRGLSIFPIHRLLNPDTAIKSDSLRQELKTYFDIEEVKEKDRFFSLMEKGGSTEHVLGMYKDKKFWLLRLKNVRVLDKEIRDKPKVFRSLDVCILNVVILKKILGVDLEDKERLTFSADAQDFVEKADNDPNLIVFFLNPVKVEQIMSVALLGERMPPKSTYFYPKVLSGLLINRLEENEA